MHPLIVRNACGVVRTTHAMATAVIFSVPNPILHMDISLMMLSSN